jgi:hypothetical protein
MQNNALERMRQRYAKECEALRNDGEHHEMERTTGPWSAKNRVALARDHVTVTYRSILTQSSTLTDHKVLSVLHLGQHAVTGRVDRACLIHNSILGDGNTPSAMAVRPRSNIPLEYH